TPLWLRIPPTRKGVSISMIPYGGAAIPSCTLITLATKAEGFAIHHTRHTRSGSSLTPTAQYELSFSRLMNEPPCQRRANPHNKVGCQGARFDFTKAYGVWHRTEARRGAKSAAPPS